MQINQITKHFSNSAQILNKFTQFYQIYPNNTILTKFAEILSKFAQFYSDIPKFFPNLLWDAVASPAHTALYRMSKCW